mmetsp:Transcript_11401/g.28883  ORF Transcript_11401/g.28883 Transcript_11401/m.28883 type:complete len:208 (-) Transcript_11401:304-927(-)
MRSSAESSLPSRASRAAPREKMMAWTGARREAGSSEARRSARYRVSLIAASAVSLDPPAPCPASIAACLRASFLVPAAAAPFNETTAAAYAHRSPKRTAREPADAARERAARATAAAAPTSAEPLFSNLASHAALAAAATAEAVTPPTPLLADPRVAASTTDAIQRCVLSSSSAHAPTRSSSATLPTVQPLTARARATATVASPPFR